MAIKQSMLQDIVELSSEKQVRRRHGILETVNPYQIELGLLHVKAKNKSNLNRIERYYFLI